MELFVEQYPQIIGTIDVTHYMALLFQGELATDPKYQSFLALESQTRSQVQQTKLSFLKPKSLRSQSRYLNVEKLVDWGIKVLNYQLRGF